MAIVHTASVLAARTIGAAGRHLTLALAPGAGDRLGFVGGQYIIVDSGRTLPSGRAAKRAYSFISRDAEQGTCELVVKHIVGDDRGAVSSFLHEVEVGASFHFSGPWGKFVAAAEPAPTLVLSTDTGITAALGLLAGARFDDRAASTHVVWIADDDFIPEAFVRDRLAGRCDHLRVIRPGADRDARIRAGVGLAIELAGSVPLGAIYLSGDGDVLYPVRDALMARGHDEAAIRIESFFNVPVKKVA
jgi:ferredoxin-NADP reductase